MKDEKQNLILKLKIYNWILDDLEISTEFCDFIMDTIESLKTRPLELNSDFLYGIGELDKCIKKITKDESKRILYRYGFNFLSYYIDHIRFLQQGMSTDDFRVSYSESDSKYFILNSKGIYETLMRRQIDMCKSLMNLISLKYPECVKAGPTIEGTEVLPLELIESINIVELVDNYIKLINYRNDIMHDILYEEELSEKEFEKFKLKSAQIDLIIGQVYRCISKNMFKDENVLKKVVTYFKRK